MYENKTSFLVSQWALTKYSAKQLTKRQSIKIPKDGGGIYNKVIFNLNLPETIVFYCAVSASEFCLHPKTKCEKLRLIDLSENSFLTSIPTKSLKLLPRCVFRISPECYLYATTIGKHAHPYNKIITE